MLANSTKKTSPMMTEPVAKPRCLKTVRSTIGSRARSS